MEGWGLAAELRRSVRARGCILCQLYAATGRVLRVFFRHPAISLTAQLHTHLPSHPFPPLHPQLLPLLLTRTSLSYPS